MWRRNLRQLQKREGKQKRPAENREEVGEPEDDASDKGAKNVGIYLHGQVQYQSRVPRYYRPVSKVATSVTLPAHSKYQLLRLGKL